MQTRQIAAEQQRKSVGNFYMMYESGPVSVPNYTDASFGTATAHRPPMEVVSHEENYAMSRNIRYQPGRGDTRSWMRVQGRNYHPGNDLRADNARAPAGRSQSSASRGG